MSYAGGGCGRLATIPAWRLLSTMTASSGTTATLSSATGALFVPLCGSSISDCESSEAFHCAKGAVFVREFTNESGENLYEA